MAKINRYDGNVQAFAAESLSNERTVFGSETQDDTLDQNINADFLRGWGIVGVNENPTKQDFNAAFYTLGQLIAYLHQAGIPEWNAAQEVFEGSVVTTTAGIYRLKAGGDSTVDPDTDDGVNWDKAPTASDYTRTFESVADLQASSAVVTGQFVRTLGYYTPGDGGGNDYEIVAAATGTDDGGSFIDLAGSGLQAKGLFNQRVYAKQFGAAGDYQTNDTTAINNWRDYCKSSNKSAWLSYGVYSYYGSLDWPSDVFLSGDGMPLIAGFPQRTNGKEFMRPGFKTQMPGSCIFFRGAGDKSINTIRSDRFSTFTYAFRVLGLNGAGIKDIGFIQDMDVFDTDGNLTSAAQDNRSDFDVGLYHTGQIGQFNNVNVFGYWNDAALVQHHEESTDTADLDYNTYTNCVITGGTALTGHDETTPHTGTAPAGQTGTRFIGCYLGGSDHHDRAAGDYTISALYQDVSLDVSFQGTRGLTVTGGNIRGYANDIVKLDHCNGVSFDGVVWEASVLNGVPNADASGKIVGTSNTGNVSIVMGDSTTELGLNELCQTINGNVVSWQSGGLRNFAVGRAGGWVTMYGDGGNGDPAIQLTDDLLSINTGWNIRMDRSASDNLVVRRGASNALRIDQDLNIFGSNKLSGAIVNNAQSGTGLVNGSLAVDNGTGWVAADTEGLSSTDNLTTIAMASPIVGQMLFIRTVVSSRDITFVHGSANIICEGGLDFTLESAGDLAVCIYDGNNWRCRKESYG